MRNSIPTLPPINSFSCWAGPIRNLGRPGPELNPVHNIYCNSLQLTSRFQCKTHVSSSTFHFHSTFGNKQREKNSCFGSSKRELRNDVVRRGTGDLRAHPPRRARSRRVQDPSPPHQRRLQVRRVAPVRQDLVRPPPRRLLRHPLRDPPRGPQLRRPLRRLLRQSRPAGGRRRAGARFVAILRAQDRGWLREARVHRIGVQ